MRIAVVALILGLVVILLAVLADLLAPAGITNLSTALVILLICIPISLALFVFLAHDQREQSRLKNKRDNQQSFPPHLLND